MSISRTEVERRRDQAQRDRATIAQLTNNSQNDFFPPAESLFKPPSKVEEESNAGEADDTTLKIESLFGRWDNFAWESGNPVAKKTDPVIPSGRSPAPQPRPAASISSSQPTRVNGEHRHHQSHPRPSPQPDEPKQNNQVHISGHHRSDSVHRLNKSGSQERTSGSGSGSLSRLPNNSHAQKNVRHPSQPRSSSQSMLQGSSVSPQTKLGSQPLMPSSGCSASPKTKHGTLPPPGNMPAKKVASPALPSHDRESHHPFKDPPGSAKSGSDHHGYRPSSVGRSHFPDSGRMSGGGRGPSTPPFPPPPHHTPHRTPPAPHRTPPAPHRTPPPPHRTPPPPHRTPPLSHIGPPPQNPVCDARSHSETKPNLTLNIKEKKPENLDDIFKEMEMSVSTPVTALSETPVKCRKAPLFKFAGKSEDDVQDDNMNLEPLLTPLRGSETPHTQQEAPPEPTKESSSLGLDVSDDSDAEPEEKADVAASETDAVSTKPTETKKEPAHSSSGESSSESDSSSGSDSESSSSESGDECEDVKKEESPLAVMMEAARPAQVAEAPEQNKPSGGWGLRQFIKPQASPASVLSSSQTANEASQGKGGSDDDVTSKVKASPRKMADISRCAPMPFTVHDDSSQGPQDSKKAGLSPYAISSLDVSKGGKGVARRGSVGDAVPVSKASGEGKAGARKDGDSFPVSRTSVDKGGSRRDGDVGAASKASGGKGGARRESSSGVAPASKEGGGKEGDIKSGPGRPKSGPSSKGSRCESDSGGKVIASPAEASRTGPQQQRKRRRTSSTGAGKKAAKPSPVTNSSSSEVDIESVTPQEARPASAKPAFSNADAVQERLGGDVSRHLFAGSSPAVSADSKKPADGSKARTPSHRDSNHHTKKSTKKSVSSQDGGGGGGKLSLGKPANGTLTDIGSIMRDIEVPRLLSPTIPAYSGESHKRDPTADTPHIPTLTCGKPSIVVRLHSARLRRAPQPRSKGGRSEKTSQEPGATASTAVAPRSGSGGKNPGAPVEAPASLKLLSNQKGSSGGKKPGSDGGLSLSPSLPLSSSSSASPAISSLPAKRKKEKDKDHPSSAKKPKSSHVTSKQASTKTAARDPEVNGVAHPQEVKKAGSKRLVERRSSASSSSSRSSHKSVPKKLKQDLQSDCDLDRPPGGSSEPQVTGKEEALPFNSYSQPVGQPAPSPRPSPRPAPTPSPRVPAVDSDSDPLDMAEQRLETQEFYMQKAKELKHIADKNPDKPSKLMPYVKSILYFIMWGHAYEKQPPSYVDPHRAFAIFNDTLSLHLHVSRIRYAVLHDSVATDRDRKLSVLILRIQSLLCLKLYIFRKAEAMKLKKIIDSDTSKGSSMKMPAHAPSPHQNHWNKNSTGTPSPMSPTPSPACSIGSVESQGSCEQSGGKMTNGNLNSSTMSSPATIAVPQRIHSITQKYLAYTHHVIQCHDLWDQSVAEERTYDLHDFFKNLDNRCGPLSLHSTMPHLVTYVNAALKELGFTYS